MWDITLYTTLSRKDVTTDIQQTGYATYSYNTKYNIKRKRFNLRIYVSVLQPVKMCLLCKKMLKKYR